MSGTVTIADTNTAIRALQSSSSSDMASLNREVDTFLTMAEKATRIRPTAIEYAAMASSAARISSITQTLASQILKLPLANTPMSTPIPTQLPAP